VAHTYLIGVSVIEKSLTCLRNGRRSPRRGTRRLRILAVGPFFSENWVAAHLEALARCDLVERVDVIVPNGYRPMIGLRYVQFSGAVARRLGNGWARLFKATGQVLRERPDIIIGYHLPWNGLMSLLLGRAAGARVLYFSVGGPAEFIGGGCYSEHALFTRIGRESQSLERRLIGLVDSFDAVLTMGSRSRTTFASLGVSKPVLPISVGVSGYKFLRPREQEACAAARYDLVTVGRLARIKRVDLLIRAVASLDPDSRPRVAVVGDGDQSGALSALARELGVEGQVDFLGWREDVESILRDCRGFVMSSASEGLPLALIEAMMAGLPAIVPDVGDIPDLVVDGKNGFLFRAGDVGHLASAIEQLLADERLRKQMAERSVAAALRYSVESRAEDWRRLFERLGSN
jgi:glycosyltransferase involved in cell wall biosynthesis